RRDVVPEEIGRELEKLQDDVHGFSFEEVEEIFKEEFNQTIDELFKNFTKEPLATASIGQVHIAHLHNGKEVAIKIQRPNIKKYDGNRFRYFIPSGTSNREPHKMG